jgi:hypothetical protein
MRNLWSSKRGSNNLDGTNFYRKWTQIEVFVIKFTSQKKRQTEVLI